MGFEDALTFDLLEPFLEGLEPLEPLETLEALEMVEDGISCLSLFQFRTGESL